MTPGRMLMFPLVVIVFPVAKGQSCSFIEVPGQKGSDSLWSDTATDTSLSACKTLCNTTELCIAGEFLSTTNTCHIYLVETNLTGQTESVFFQWTYTNERDVSDGFPVALTVGLVVGGVALAGMAAAGGVYLKKRNNGYSGRVDTE
ncbi:uncharacterized protein LOC124152282 isoform X2 [Haliotis rufescens]|uniref:uncharacterized protein LOC124152282 isoform X2 n=1 Tax=Haliotis rufescens TaxID=6454 RepID=UPI00201EA917|nr:uncharacterized protein LOC124152282 isoform X2 [Haliotis rufescens]